MHGGLSPELKTLDILSTIPRDREIPQRGALCDLMWSDPEEVESWTISPRLVLKCSDDCIMYMRNEILVNFLFFEKVKINMFISQ